MADETAGRLAALKGYGVLDTPNEPEFDAIVRQAAAYFDAPVALVSLVDENRQWFKAKVGVEPSETPLAISFCTHAIRGPDVFVVEDTTQDPRFADFTIVTGDPNVRFYAGAPLKTPDGHRLGTLCVLDTKARGALSDEQKQALESMAARVSELFEARKARNRK